MQQKVTNWFENQIPNWKNATYLVAVSGGVDSVVLCFLFQKLGLNLQIAHCNFQLRGEESDGDEALVKELATKLKVKFNSINFNTKEFAKDEKLSTQEAARKLRYDWFETVRKENKLDFVVVGTHKSDETETMLINLIRGAGIRGLHGILPVKNRLVRPLLAVVRTKIVAFANENSLKWREDSSNESDNYMRNKIRHHVVPVLKEIRENVEEQFSESAVAIRDYQQVLENEIKRLKPTLMTQENGYWKIDKSKLLTLKPMYVYLYELLLDYGFSYAVCKDIAVSLYQNKQPGSIFYGKTASLVNDRKFLIVKGNLQKNNKVTELEISDKTIEEPIKLMIEQSDIADFQLTKSPKTAAFDFAKLTFPLTLRRWEQGDRFQPFGMKGMKKVSDFLIDNKVPRIMKDDVFVLESSGKIVWVVGFRIDDRFKVTVETKRIYFLELINS